MKRGLWPVLVLPVLAACGGGAGTITAGPVSHPPPTSSPTPSHRIEQLKTPTNPPVPLQEVASYLLPSPENVDYYLPGIAWGPDSNIWVSEVDADKIARVTPSGAITEYPVPTASAYPMDMAVGPDAKVWFSETTADAIAKIDTSTGTITEYPLPQSQFPVIHGEGPRGIIAGPDGNMWFAAPDSSQIGQMSTAGSLLAAYQVPTPDSGDTRMAVGPDGNIWFTESYSSKIGRLTLATGIIDEFPTPTQSSYPHGIAAGGDGNIWFSERDANQVGRITPSGVITEFTTPTKISRPLYMTSTPDGTIWFDESFANGICRVDPTALWFVEYQGDSVALQGITAGNNSTTLWVTDINHVAVDEFAPGPSAHTRRATQRPRSSLESLPLLKGKLIPVATNHHFT